MTSMAPEKKWLIPELFALLMDLRDDIKRRFRDIERRLELGIYATAQDVTMYDIATELRALQAKTDQSLMDFIAIDEHVNELLKRGWFK